MVLPRVLTAICLVPLVGACVWFGSIPFFLFVTAVCMFCVWEYSLMAEDGGYPNQLYVSLFGAFMLMLALYLDGSSLGPIRKTPGALFIFLLWCFIVFLREFAREDKGLSFLRIITTVSGVVFFAFFLGHLLLIRDLRMAGGEGVQMVGRPLTFFLIFIIWAVDTGAWFVGRLIGRHPLAPKISPKKSWEGSIGGTLIACLLAWLLQAIMLRQVIGPLEAMVYALVIAITAQVSDLIESMVKRSFGAKDSGNLLPGHGGFLDRFDSFIFAAPFYYYLLIGTGRFN